MKKTSEQRQKSTETRSGRLASKRNASSSLRASQISSTSSQPPFTFLADTLPTAIAYITVEQRCLFANKPYLKLFGSTRKQIINQNIKTVFTRQAYKKFLPYLTQTLVGKKTRYEDIFTDSNHVQRKVIVQLLPYKTTKNDIEGVFIHMSETKISKRHSYESELRLTRFMDANIIGVTISDLNGRIYEANDIFLKTIGYKRRDLTSGKMNWLAMTPKEYLKQNEALTKIIMEKGSAKPFEKEYIRKDGTRVPVLISKVLLDKVTKRTLAFILDMTEQKKSQQKKDEFIALASHELKTPLTSLKLLSQMTKHQIKEIKDRQMNTLMSKMDKQIRNVDKLVNNLLDVSRLQSGKLSYNKTTYSLERLVHGTVQELQKVLHKHTLIYKTTTKGKVSADRERIKQVISNLITNAVKYSPLSDKVIITLAKNKNYLQVSIQDFGVGISKEQQEKIFERYYQITEYNTKRLSGLGLGLYLSKEIIDRHKGKISVKSHNGEGSIFTFSLPLVKTKLG